MARRIFIPVLLVLALLAPAEARAGGDYVFVGGSPAARATVTAALEASAFDWNVVGRTVTIGILRCGCAGAQPGEIVLDEGLLTETTFGGRCAWGVVQHEYAHQVGFVLSSRQQRRLTTRLAAADWCYEVPGLGHDEHACERFASTLASAYWRSSQNNQASEAVMRPRRFSELVDRLLGVGDGAAGRRNRPGR